ncbi:ABC transporter permease [Rhodocyclus tenuis]|uniref:MlaE family lipid ABC transporter permease subunit n=2 Tax=Rhodocyclus TaxID=1064 RepID=A0A6L5JSV7_RHOTE|nr:ABC transporter permease [Rhodocyclus gracilis]MQY50299.1 MlaE family lipid ABC transporter permease subunit [Rhodocyclus gracilis]MRD71804.1 MlaE family lipid ABC transporter permease subunit [Rhodocyclus gracilis]NJA87802.1 ABC transporter permease [Rhodocyclus gracilis]
MSPATLDDEVQGGLVQARLAGDWTLATLGPQLSVLDARLRQLNARSAHWDLRAVTRLDSVGALLLWRAWGERWPDETAISETHRRVLVRAAGVTLPVRAVRAPYDPATPLLLVGRGTLTLLEHSLGVIALIGQIVLDLIYLIGHPRDIPWREFSATLYKSGAQALPVVALVGFLIGVVLSYLSSLQLKTFGADVFIVNLLGISVIRELGPVLVAVLVAGRSGSAMTAQIGVMRVTEEIDALATMGISSSLRLVLPKVLALSLATPLLVLWCSAAGMLGGMVSAHLEMGLSYAYFIDTLPKVVPVANIFIGLGKGVAFGVLVGLVACYFGLRVRPNTESLSAGTTSSVVTSITAVIIVDAVFAVLTRSQGIP